MTESLSPAASNSSPPTRVRRPRTIDVHRPGYRPLRGYLLRGDGASCGGIDASNEPFLGRTVHRCFGVVEEDRGEQSVAIAPPPRCKERRWCQKNGIQTATPIDGSHHGVNGGHVAGESTDDCRSRPRDRVRRQRRLRADVQLGRASCSRKVSWAEIRSSPSAGESLS